MFHTKRAYDEPSKSDGIRILVDRLWPRGLSKETIAIDGWLKDLAPSDRLRQWFGHKPERWSEFKQRYFQELEKGEQTGGEAAAALADLRSKRRRTVTLVYAAHDREHNNAVALAEYLAKAK